MSNSNCTIKTNPMNGDSQVVFKNAYLFNGFYKLNNVTIRDSGDQYLISINYSYDAKYKTDHYDDYTFYLNKKNARGAVFGSQSHVNDYLIENINKSKAYYFCTPDIQAELDKYCSDYRYKLRFETKYSKINIGNVDEMVPVIMAIIIVNKLIEIGQIKDLV